MTTLKAREALYKKMPDLKVQNITIRLNRVFLKTLTDLEFTVLWHMAGLDIEVSEPTKEYIEERRVRLGLKFTPIAGYDLQTKK